MKNKLFLILALFSLFISFGCASEPPKKGEPATTFEPPPPSPK